MSENNPFFSVSLLPYQAPRFDLVDVSHYRPAFDEGVRRQRKEIALSLITRSRLILPIPWRPWSRAVSCWRG